VKCSPDTERAYGLSRGSRARFLGVRAGLLAIGSVFVLVGLALLNAVRSPVAPEADRPFLAAAAALFLIAGTGLLLRQRWAMFLGLPAFCVVAGFAVVQLAEQLRQGDQPGSFAVIGVPMFALLGLFAVVGSVFLVRSALSRHRF
jgi:uncharacterized membrane protein (DUF2068 family)